MSQTDLEIAEAITPQPIAAIAERLGLSEDDYEPVGRLIAKVDPKVRERPSSSASKLVLVSAITPTPAGEGKTTTCIGLAQGLAKLGKSVCLALREPSLGPCMGMKGGATGGGYSQILPAGQDQPALHRDLHAVSAAHNLLAALLDNHLYFGNALGIDPRRTLWKRVMDMNDRALRDVIIGLGGYRQGVPRESGFDITAASEVMAMLCLAEDAEDLRARLDRTLLGFTDKGEPVTAGQLKASGAMLALLQDALKPNLVQTLEGVPALVHGGPFANIAHGCNSVVATKVAMHLADWTITEAGFGFDLGAEKFFDIKCRGAGLDTAAVVLVATARALKMHGGVDRKNLSNPDPEAVRRGLPNLEKHVESIQAFQEVPVVALNRFASDTEEEIEVIRECCFGLGVPFALSEHHQKGGEGAVALAQAVLNHAEEVSEPFVPLYSLEERIPDKILAVAKRMYGAERVVFTPPARKDLEDVERLGYGSLPVCIAKTPASLSDDPQKRGRPSDFDVTVRALEINAGAGFIVALTGDILRMPGLPRAPLAEQLDLHEGKIVGLR